MINVATRYIPDKNHMVEILGVNTDFAYSHVEHLVLLGEKNNLFCTHGVVMMLPTLLALVKGFHHTSLDSLTQGQWSRALLFSLLCLNKFLNKQWSSIWSTLMLMWCHYNVGFRESCYQVLAIIRICRPQIASFHLPKMQGKKNLPCLTLIQ